MQNYRNNAMPYNNNYNNNYNANYRRSVATPAASCEEEHHDDNMVLAMAYVKWQKWQKIYEAEKALQNGTIFQELNLPFCGIGGCQK